MGELSSQITIVGKKQYASRIAVKTTHRINTLRASVLYEINHSMTLLRIIRGSNCIFGFIQKNIHFLLATNRLIMEFHLIGRKHLCTKLAYDHTINGNHTCEDKIISLTT